MYPKKKKKCYQIFNERTLADHYANTLKTLYANGVRAFIKTHPTQAAFRQNIVILTFQYRIYRENIPFIASKWKAIVVARQIFTAAMNFDCGDCGQ